MLLETDDVDEGPPSTLVVTRVDTLESPLRGRNVLPAPAASGSTSSSFHYSQLKCA